MYCDLRSLYVLSHTLNLNSKQRLCLTVNNECFPPQDTLGSCHNFHWLNPPLVDDWILWFDGPWFHGFTRCCSRVHCRYTSPHKVWSLAIFILSVMLFPHETKMRIPFEGRFQVCQTWDSLVASLWSNQVFADVVLIIAEDGSEFRYHRCILSLVSPVFYRMLSLSITSNFKIFESKSAPSAVLSAEVAVRTLGSFWHYRRDSGQYCTGWKFICHLLLIPTLHKCLSSLIS